MVKIKSPFFLRGKPTYRWRDTKTGQWTTTPEFFRATFACNNVPIENRYHHFSVTRIAEVIDLDDLKENLLHYMESEIGYERDVWWFSPVFGIEYPAPIEAFEPDYYEQHRVGRKS